MTYIRASGNILTTKTDDEAGLYLNKYKNSCTATTEFTENLNFKFCEGYVYAVICNCFLNNRLSEHYFKKGKSRKVLFPTK